MANLNLTTLANVKAWAAITSVTDDVMLSRLIQDSSRLILAYLQRPSLLKATYNEVYDGYGTTRFFLNQWPVLAVSIVIADGMTVSLLQSPQTGYGSGYILDAWNGAPPGQQQAITRRGGIFCYGKSNIAVTYTAGYSVTAETQTVPAAPYTVTASQTNGTWAQDDGVTYANGTPLTPVASAPAVGQYIPPAADGVYTFAAADTAAQMLISYSYIPFDVEQACIELVAERYRYRQHIGSKSASVSGAETTSYVMSGMTDAIKMRLLPYCSKSVI